MPRHDHPGSKLLVQQGRKLESIATSDCVRLASLSPSRATQKATAKLFYCTKLGSTKAEEPIATSVPVTKLFWRGQIRAKTLTTEASTAPSSSPSANPNYTQTTYGLRESHDAAAHVPASWLAVDPTPLDLPPTTILPRWNSIFHSW